MTTRLTPSALTQGGPWKKRMMRLTAAASLAATFATPAVAQDSAEREAFQRLRAEIRFDRSPTGSKMSYPLELSEPLAPYIQCTVRSSGVGIEVSGELLAPEPGKDCSHEREMATEQVSTALQAEGISAPRLQQRIIDAALDMIDRNAAVLKRHAADE